MNAMTIVIYFEPGERPESLQFGDELAGGKITALASYDAISALEVAEEALERSLDDVCIEAYDTLMRIESGKTI